MLFSGHIRYLKCTSCGKEYSDVHPTSLVPIGLVLALGFRLWIPVVARFGWSPWPTLVACATLAVLFPCLVYLGFEIPSRMLLKKCMKCGDPLACTGVARYDFGFLPDPIEFVIYVISLGVPLALKIWLA